MNKVIYQQVKSGSVLDEAVKKYPGLNSNAALVQYFNFLWQVFTFSSCPARQQHAWAKMEEIRELNGFLETHRN